MSATQPSVVTNVILKADTITKQTFRLGSQVLEGVAYKNKYYFRKVTFAGKALALSSYAKDSACGIDCFLVEEEREFSLWQALPLALSSVLEEA
ncbi:MAG: hypothetical protein AAFY30_04990 [Cyanobacteria bacterium J06642_12]